MPPAPSSSSTHYITVLFACTIIPHRCNIIYLFFINYFSWGGQLLHSGYINVGNIRIIYKGICFSRQLLFNAYPLAVYCLSQCSSHVGDNYLFNHLRLSKIATVCVS